MLSPRLTNCPECANIPSLLKKIDCKLAELGNSLYNNISYMLNQPIPAGDILQLIAYRRILTHKYCNPNYLHEYSVAMIASRVIRITVGCVSRCNTPEPCLEVPCDITIVQNPSTTTTSTSTLPPPPTTTTTTTIELVRYYLANQYTCPDCNTSTNNARVKVIGDGLNLGSWYKSAIDETQVFHVTGIASFDNLAELVDVAEYLTCPSICTPTTTTTTTITPTTTTTTTTSGTTTTTTTCNGSTPHPYPATLIFSRDFITFIGSLVDACQAAACLQAGTCNPTGVSNGHFDDAIPVIGGGFYGATIGGCTPPITTGYHVINLSGTYTVINMLNGYVVSYPTCEPTTTTTTTAVPTTTTTTTAMVLPSVTVCGRIVTNENSTLTNLGDGTPIAFAANLTEYNIYNNDSTPCYLYWNFDPAESYRGNMYNQLAIHLLAPPGWRSLTTEDVDYFYQCNPYQPNENLYAASPGNWNPTYWTDQINAGETGINFQGYGVATWFEGVILWEYDGRAEAQGYSPSTDPDYGSNVNTFSGGYVSWGNYNGFGTYSPLYARFIKL